jgi:Fur family ferric uptake transcriptional regulator
MQPDADRWLAHTDAVLREAGLRTSPGRAAVTETLARGDCLMSAQDVVLRLRGETARAASIATVYRTLDLLHEHGLVRRVDAGEGIARYERVDPSGEAHHHVVFDDGSVEPFSDAELSRAIAGLGQRLGLEIDSCELIVHARRAH